MALENFDMVQLAIVPATCITSVSNKTACSEEKANVAPGPFFWFHFMSSPNLAFYVSPFAKHMDNLGFMGHIEDKGEDNSCSGVFSSGFGCSHK